MSKSERSTSSPSGSATNAHPHPLSPCLPLTFPLPSPHGHNNDSPDFARSPQWWVRFGLVVIVVRLLEWLLVKLGCVQRVVLGCVL